MRYKLKGIVLNFIRYSESSIISKIYTDLFGLQTYIVNNVRSMKPKYNIALFQPVTQLELVAYHNYNGNINRVTEIRIENPYRNIPYVIRKTTVTLFLSEVLLKTLKEESPNPELFGFISDSFSRYDDLPENYQNFHIQFLLRYLKYLGFEPSVSSHLFEGASNSRIYSIPADRELKALLNNPYGSQVAVTHTQRLDLVELLTAFIARNMGIDENFKSLAILKEVFN